MSYQQETHDVLSAPSSWVEPAAPIKVETIKCSALDNLTAQVYPSPTKFFPLLPGWDPLVHYENLKRALAIVIYTQPHLAGILRKDDAGRASIEIPAAPHAGAHLYYRDLRDDLSTPSYEQFKAHGFPLADGNLDGLSKFRPDPFPHCVDGDPIICPQMTVIRGGIVVTGSCTHAIGDLVQAKEFMGNWGKFHCLLAEARANGQPEPPLPAPVPADCLDRSRLRPDVPIEEDLDKLIARAAKLPHMVVLDPRDPDKMAELIRDLVPRARLTHKDLANASEDDLREPSISVWTFPIPSLKQIQGAALSVVPKGTKLSSTDCTTAFAWQRFFMAKWAPGQEGPTQVPEEARIVFAGNIRHRLTPPLPMNYLPACVDLFPVTAVTAELAASTPEALAKTAKLVRTSNNKWSEAEYMEMCEIAQAHPMNPGIIPAGPIDLLITDHTRTGNDMLINWGPGLGVCEGFREPYFERDIPIGELTLLPRWGNQHVEIMICGEAIVMDRLKKDPLMNSMATCQFVLHDFVEKVAKLNSKSKL